MTATELSRVAWEGEGLAAAALRAALLPASGLFRIGSRIHHGLYDVGLRRAERAGIPVLSVGNLRVGGSGKTPFTGWVVERLLAAGRRPAVLHGGYGSDEPELHRRWHPEVPVFTGRDRAESVRAAQARGCDVAVLDDGFQHRRLARELDIVLVAAEHGVEPIRLLPRGPWREPLPALGRAGAVVVTRKTASSDEAAMLAARLAVDPGGRPAIARIHPDGWSGLEGPHIEAPTGPGLAVAAIAEPESFFQTLESMGIEVVARLAFPDHHVYSAADIESIERAAAGRTVLVTGKDAVKLGALAGRADVRVLRQRVTIEEGETDLLKRIEGALT